MNRGRYVTYSISYFDKNGKVKGKSITHYTLTGESEQQDIDALNVFYSANPGCEIIGLTKSFHNTNG